MPCRIFMNSGPLNGDAYDTRFNCSLPRQYYDATTLWRPEYNWERRNLRACSEPHGWASQWPRGGLLSANPANPMSILGQCIESGGWGNAFEPDSTWGPGAQSTKFIKGVTVDGAGVPIAGVTVEAFITATDLRDGPGEVSAGDGTFRAGVYQGTGNHYLVAYITGSPDKAGTTLNTLAPTDLDGASSNVYLRDPTVADTPGGSTAGVSRSRAFTGM